MLVSGHHGAPAADDVNDLKTALSGPTVHYRRVEQSVSSHQLAPAVEGHLTLARSIVDQRLRTATGFAALAEIAGLAAWLAADRGDQASARRRYTEAVQHAKRAHHPLLVSYMTASLDHFTVESGDPRQGVVLLDRAHTQLDASASDSARAWLASLRAVAYAELGDRTAAYASMRTAETLTSRQRGEPAWPWVFTFDEAKASRYQAAAFARLGDVRAATTAFHAAQPALIGPKPRALIVLDHARVLARTGEIAHGCALATEALQIGRDYGSERIIAGVRAFRAELSSRAADIRALDEALTALYAEETW